MDPIDTGVLPVPGARLYYEVRGTGPVLLLICGGIYDATGYAGLAGQLADGYTVVTYDRRGNSRSPLAGAPQRQSIAVHSDDAHRLLTEVGGPGDVFGNSSGAQIALELTLRHPAQVRTVVAHEPPLLELLPDRDHWREVIGQVTEAFDTRGAAAAMAVFGAAMGMGGGQPRRGGNVEFFIGYEVPPFAGYTPDVAALNVAASKGSRIVLGAGEESVDEPPHRAAYAMAAAIGAPTVLFPGDHGGFGTRTEAFAARLREVLAG
jgi:pimeloyl-ACP methyl ester carboxylesterase